jgi:ribosome-binding protein aMBF1 (putative translation factor)
VVVSGFAKKTEKTDAAAGDRRRIGSPPGLSEQEIQTMSDLTKYTQTRAARDPEFADGLETGYAEFKVGALLRQAREKAGLTQEQVAERLATKKSAISRIENSAGSIRFSTLERYARAIGWQLSLEFRPPRSRPGPSHSLR